MKKLLLVFTVCFFATAGQLLAQQRSIQGVIVDDTGETLIGANIVVEGTSVGTTTDFNGKFQLQVPQNSQFLIVSYTGYQDKKIELGVENVLNIELSENAAILDEVVVTALGFETQRGKVGVASSQVDGSALVSSGETGLINSMAGKSAGVNIVQTSGEPGASSKIQIRGATSITGNLEPLVVIDGVPIFNDSYYGQGFGGNGPGSGGSIGSGGGVTQQSRLNDINPEDIENIEVLRGASAAAVWGSRAANGVLVITTKKGKYNPKKRFTVQVNSSISLDQINKKISLNETYGQGVSQMFVPNTPFSWGDKIANRKGGTDDFITDPNDANYQGYFEADGSKNKYYGIAAGDANNLHGGKNDKTVYTPYDQIFETGIAFNNSLSLSTAGVNGSTYFSISNLSQEGIIRENSNYDRTSVRLNATRLLGDKFTLNASTAYTYSTSDRVQMGSNLNGLFLGGLRSAADFNDSDAQGTYFDPAGNAFPNRQRAYRNSLGNRTNSSYDNPIWMMNNILSNNVVNRFIGKLELRYEPLSWLNFTARAGGDTYTDEREDFYPSVSSGLNNGGRFTKETITRRQLNLDLIGRARFNLTDHISANVLLGTGINEQKLDDHGSTARAFINPLSPPQLSNATNLLLFNVEQTIRTTGIYGTIGLELYDQFYINLSGRQDYLSALPAADNGVFYPAANMAWQFSKLLPNKNILSSGRVRAGYGQVGRGPNPYLTSTSFYTPTAANSGYGEGWNPGVNPIAYGGAFAQSTTAGNPNIKPEIKTEIEAGFDVGFLKDRIGLSFTYYDNQTDDLIIQVRTPESSGFRSQIANAASIDNQGIELELNGDVLRIGHFNWNLYGNFTRSRNEVTEMAGTNSILLSGFSNTSSRAVVGEQLGVIWGSRWARDAAGDIVLDEQGFPTQDNQAGVLGDPNPDFRAGMGSMFSWKNLSLNVLFDWSKGGDIWNGTKGALAFFGRAGFQAVETTLSADQANSLLIYQTFQDNTGTTRNYTVAEFYPQLQNSDGSYTVRGEVKDFGGGGVFLDETWYYTGLGSGFTGPDEQFVEDASWFRLRELTLAYQFEPAKLGINWLSNANLTLTGRNLILWTEYDGNDPDTNLNGPGNNGFGLDYFQNPSTRSYKLSLNVSF